jgi:hypothetical protein
VQERDSDLLQMSSIGGTAKASQEADNVLLLQYGNPNDVTEGLRVVQVRIVNKRGRAVVGGGGSGRSAAAPTS